VSPCAHVAGFPLEETIGTAGPVLLLSGGALLVLIRRLAQRCSARLHNARIIP
jgi:hypothetical protein